ncbi:hypothetical protein SLS62_005523 [Diatrype stigma]|uniref:DUF6314 domain-containing protein n=1 Tax=Diatrype stigma TaxID=117547 RepID=A0AAN9YST2_9PEZI
MMTKTVCIVGAGPSGLVAAKTLLRDAPSGSFKVTIFEAQSRIGGLWPSHKDDSGGLMHPFMVANQSKHTVQFSDLAWDELDPQMPRAWQVGQYLERYLKKYLADVDIRLGHKVVHTELQNGGSWRVRTESDQGGEETSVFDYLLVGTGFFGKPIWPDYIPQEADVPIIHSSKYRDLKTLLAGRKEKDRGGKILVVGGQMSGIEIAGTIATHLSSAVHSPGEKEIAAPEKYSVHHVAHRPAWVFPLFTSPKIDKLAAPFLPCDLPSYNLANRPHPLVNSQGHVSVESARVFNSIYSSVLGTDQSEFSPATKIDGSLMDEPPYLAMSSFYMDFVRQGLITISHGKLATISGRTATLVGSSSIPEDEEKEEVANVAAVVLATGFDPSSSLSFLPTSVRETLAHLPDHPSLPLALAFHGTHHPSLPTLGFVGFYRSPYWGVMEMQARFLARLWATPTAPDGGAAALPVALQSALETDDSIERIFALRASSSPEPSRLSQFPMGDYAFLMQEFARALDMSISPSSPLDTPPLANGKSMDILTPARYSIRGQIETETEAAKSLAQTRDAAVGALQGARFVAGAVFRSLLGEWALERDLVSRLPSHPSGRFVGTARFLLRAGTADGRESPSSPAEGGDDLGLEYLYMEDGEFSASNGLKFRATRRYVYRYDERRDRLSAWFVRTDDPARADYLFHELDFVVPSSEAVDQSAVAGEPGAGPGVGVGDPSRGKRTQEQQKQEEQEHGWRAEASHLCVEDLYDVHYEFAFKAVNLRDWRLGYTVRGPKKDYTINGVYRRK